MSDRGLTRSDVLNAFGITEEDMAAMEARDGYEAARAEANSRQEAFVAWMDEFLAAQSERLTELVFGGDAHPEGIQP